MEKHAFIIALISSLVAGAALAEPPLPVPKSLVGQPYPKARRAILRAGWHPDFRPSTFTAERDKQRTYPELRFCAVDRPYCSLYFTGKGECLRVITQGEQISKFTVISVDAGCQGQ